MILNNPDFKVRPFINAEYLQNGSTYDHSYYWMWIGNRTHSFEWYHFQWPLTHILRSGIWIQINPSIRIWIPDHFQLKCWCQRRFAHCLHSPSAFVIVTLVGMFILMYRLVWFLVTSSGMYCLSILLTDRWEKKCRHISYRLPFFINF